MLLPRGGRTIKPETDVHLRQLAKTSTYVHLLLFLVRFWAFLGKVSSKTRENKLSAFPKVHRGEFGGGGGGGWQVDFFSRLFVVALVKRLSGRGTQKRDKNVLRGRASKTV
jgi:hypothetical protein